MKPFALVALAAVVVGAIVGVIAGIVSNWFHLIILFPIVEGAIVAVAMRVAVRGCRLRSTPGAAALGALGGFMAFSVAFVSLKVGIRLRGGCVPTPTRADGEVTPVVVLLLLNSHALACSSATSSIPERAESSLAAQRTGSVA